MSFAASWYRATCALLLLTLYFSMFSFYLPFLLSLSLSPSPSFSLSVSLSLCLRLSVVARRVSSDALLPSILFLINLTFHTLSLHSSYKIHQPFTDYLLQLPSSELLEKHLFRSRANRRLVTRWKRRIQNVTTCLERSLQLCFHATRSRDSLERFYAVGVVSIQCSCNIPFRRSTGSSARPHQQSCRSSCGTSPTDI